MFHKGQRLIHQYQGGEYEVFDLDNQFLKLAVVDRNYPKNKWKVLTYRLQDCVNDFIPIS